MSGIGTIVTIASATVFTIPPANMTVPSLMHAAVGRAVRLQAAETGLSDDQ